MIRSSLCRSFWAALCLLVAAASAHGDWVDPAGAPSELMPKAEQSLLLDAIALDSGRIIAVGERGHVLLSDDDGGSWRQVVAPTRSTLTAVAASDTTVVVVGHDGVILHSTDAGETWRRVREEPYSPDNVTSDSNGSPLLDVLFLDANRVLAVGAYRLMLTSADGGATWAAAPMTLAEDEDAPAPADDESADRASAHETEVSDPLLFSEDELMLDDEIDPHLNAIVRTAPDELLLAGERGMLFRSNDDGMSWRRLDLPYGGSMFGALSLGGPRIAVFGLRGRAFESGDSGDTWNEIDTGTQATLFDGDVGADGTIVLVGAQGVMLRRAPDEDAFRASVFTTDAGETPTSSAVLPLGRGELLLFGDRGVFVRRQP